MPDNNGNLTDKLSVEISASVNPAVSAIDKLQGKLRELNGSLALLSNGGSNSTALNNLASGIDRLNSAVAELDPGKITNASSALTKLATAAGKVAQTFGKKSSFAKNAEEVTEFSDALKASGELLADSYGVKNKEGINEMTSALGRLSNAMKLGGQDSEAYMTSLMSLQNVIRKFADTDYDEWLDLYDDTYVKPIRQDVSSAGRNGSHVVIGSADFIDNDAARRGRMKLAPGYTTNKYGVDVHGNAWSHHTSVNDEQLAEEISNTYGKSFENYTDFLDFFDTESTASASDHAAAKNYAADASVLQMYLDEILPKLQEASTTTRTFNQEMSDNSGFETLSSGLRSLDGINVPDFSNLDALGKAVEKFGGEKGTNAGANIAPVITALQSISGTEIPSFEGITALSKAVEKLGNDKSVKAGETFPTLVTMLQSLSGINIPDFSGLTALSKAIEKLGNDKSQNAAWVLPNVMAELQSFSGHFNGLSLDGSVIETISKLGSAFSRFGGKNATEAITNLPQLSDAIRQVVDDLNNLPAVSDRTQELIVALGQLAKSHGNVANATKGVTSGHNLAGQAIQKFTSRVSSAYNNSNFLATAYNKVKDGVSGFAQSMDKATSHTQSLTMVIVKARTLLWGFRRIFSMFSGSLELASSLVEVQNVIDNVFTENYADKIEDMSKSVKDSLGMSELSFKQYASRYQAMGKAMGITNSQMVSAQNRLKGMGVAYGETNGNMQDMSVNLTRLAADLASFYDIDQKTAFEKLQAVYTGQTRPLNVAA